MDRGGDPGRSAGAGPQARRLALPPKRSDDRPDHLWRLPGGRDALGTRCPAMGRFCSGRHVPGASQSGDAVSGGRGSGDGAVRQPTAGPVQHGREPGESARAGSGDGAGARVLLASVPDRGVAARCAALLASGRRQSQRAGGWAAPASGLLNRETQHDRPVE